MTETKIEWTDYTFNPWWGCVKVSPGCKNCYAENLSNRFGHDVFGVNKPRRFFDDRKWDEPLKWNKKAAKNNTRYRVFCASMADVFEDNPNLVEPRKRLFELIEKTPNLDWLLLTKRPENVPLLTPEPWNNDDFCTMPSNVWLGASAENEARYIKSIFHLSRSQATVKFLSIEPYIEYIDLTIHPPTGIDWMIFGGESGNGARHLTPVWVEYNIDDCRHFDVTPFVKQLGTGWAKSNEAIHPKGGDPSEWPAGLRVRELPVTTSLSPISYTQKTLI